MRRLDSIPEFGRASDIYLKIDVQGFELRVLRGSVETLPRVIAIESEVSFAPIYEGQALAPQVLVELQRLGFEPIWIERGFVDPMTHRMLQADVLFVRNDSR